MSVLTLVTITRNDLVGVRRTFASLAMQTYRDIQHIVIDGGSVDGTPEWARAHSVFSETTIVSEPDDGIYDAMNKGLELTTGDVVCFLNSGDCLARSDALALVVESYIRDRWTWTFGLGQVVDKQFRPVRSRQKAQYSWFRQTFLHYNLCHQAVYMQTDLVRQLGGFDGRFRIAADYHLLTKAGMHTEPHILPHLMALALEGGLSQQRPARSLLEAHSARVDALAMGRSQAFGDLLWTYLLMAKTEFRRTVRRALVWLSRQPHGVPWSPPRELESPDLESVADVS